MAEAVGTRTRGERQDPATRTFQALRIHVNQELEEAVAALPQCVELLEPGGRLVVISFHSLEDRIVKRFIARRRAVRAATLRSRGLPCARATCPQPKLATRRQARQARRCRESRRNPRARSAILRVAERTRPLPADWPRDSTRINLILLARARSRARSSLVTSQHQARKLYVELQREQAREARSRSSTASCSSSRARGRCTRASRRSRATQLGMRCPTAARVEVVGRRERPRGERRALRAARAALEASRRVRARACCSAALALLFVVLAGRSLYLQGLDNDFLQAKGESRYSRVIEIARARAA